MTGYDILGDELYPNTCVPLLSRWKQPQEEILCISDRREEKEWKKKKKRMELSMRHSFFPRRDQMRLIRKRIWGEEGIRNEENKIIDYSGTNKERAAKRAKGEWKGEYGMVIHWIEKIEYLLSILYWDGSPDDLNQLLEGGMRNTKGGGLGQIQWDDPLTSYIYYPIHPIHILRCIPIWLDQLAGILVVGTLIITQLLLNSIFIHSSPHFPLCNIHHGLWIRNTYNISMIEQ